MKRHGFKATGFSLLLLAALLLALIPGEAARAAVGFLLVRTDPASGVTVTGATLNGTVNVDGGDYVVTFQYGLTPGCGGSRDYGTSIDASPLNVMGSLDTPVNAVIGGLTPNTTYYFCVVIYDRIKDSDRMKPIPGPELTFRTSAGGGGGVIIVLNPPEGVTASDGAYPNKVQVSWSVVYGADYYLVYRSESLGGSKIPANGYRTTSLGGGDIWAVPGVTYYYWVQACNNTFCSALSAYDTGWR